MSHSPGVVRPPRAPVISIPKVHFFLQVGNSRKTSSHFLDDVLWERCRNLKLDTNRVIQLNDFKFENVFIDFETQENRYLLLGSHESNLHILDYDVNRLKNLLPRTVSTMEPQGRRVKKFTSLQWFRGFNGFFITSQEQTVKLWDTENLKPLATYQMRGLKNCTDISASNRNIAVGSENRKIYIIDPKSGVHISHLSGHSNEVLKVKWCPDSAHYLASGGDRGEVLIWDIRRSSSCLRKLDPNPERTSSCRAHSHTSITGLHWSGGNSLFTCGEKSEDVKKWNVRTFRHRSIRLNTQNRSDVQDLVCSESYGRKGCYIYLAVRCNPVVLEEATGKQLEILRGHVSHVHQLVFNAKENELFSACRDYIIAWANFPKGTRQKTKTFRPFEITLR